jgi:hypothetical protein
VLTGEFKGYFEADSVPYIKEGLIVVLALDGTIALEGNS